MNPGVISGRRLRRPEAPSPVSRPRRAGRGRRGRRGKACRATHAEAFLCLHFPLHLPLALATLASVLGGGGWGRQGGSDVDAVFSIH